MTEEELNEAYRKVAEESRKIDKKKLKWAKMGPNIHGIKRFNRIPLWDYRSRLVRPYNT